jgi:hypothetical protein
MKVNKSQAIINGILSLDETLMAMPIHCEDT